MKEAIKFWQYWLIGKKFKVYSDHKPLENRNIGVRTDEELGDMTNFLAQFDFDIIYKPGKENEEADCLSRNPVLNANTADSEEIIRTVNLLTLTEIMNYQKNLNEDSEIVTKQGIKYKVNNTKNEYKILLPEEGAKELVRRTHNKLGHLGTNNLIIAKHRTTVQQNFIK